MKKTNRSLLISAMSLLLCLSMLVGSTFAWFTDEATAGVNQILAGELDVGMDYWNGTAWVSVDGESLFPEDLLWEPGHTEVVYLRISNLGNLALKYRLGVTIAEETGSTNVLGETFTLSQYIRFGAVEAQPTFASRDAARAALSESQVLTAGYTKTGTIAANEGPQYVALVVYMPESVGNEANHMAGVAAPTIKLGIDLIATQAAGESDSFGNNYDANAAWPYRSIKRAFTMSITDKIDPATGNLTEMVVISATDEAQRAEIPANVKLAEGADKLTFAITSMEKPNADVNTTSRDEILRSIDIHVDGIAEDNTVPMTFVMKELFPKGLNGNNVKLYHVEGGETKEMTLADVPTNHNEFSYDPITGDAVITIASFSEVATYANTDAPWDGETFDYSWYNADGALTISNANQFAAFRNIVDGVEINGVYTIDDFAGQKITLGADINLYNHNFDPIGWGYDNAAWNVGDKDGKVFKGTFDGDNHTIYGLFQDGWELKNIDGKAYTYTNCGFGLFASALDATFENLTIDGADIRVECVETGVLVGLAQGQCTFRNINILGCKAANYQRPVGGVVGEVSPKMVNGVAQKGDASKHTFENVYVDSNTVIGSLWGDFDAPVGGVIGAYWDDAGVTSVDMKNVTVACRLDVYNDVTSTYQWYAYRRAGMLIGDANSSLGNPRDGRTAEAKYLTCSNVIVYYGEWADYHYCEFNKANPNWPWVRVEPGENCSGYSNPRWGRPIDPVSGNPVTDSVHEHGEGEGHLLSIPFHQLYGGGQGVYGEDEHLNVSEGIYTVTYMDRGEVLHVDYVANNKVAYDCSHADGAGIWPITNVKDANNNSPSYWVKGDNSKFEGVNTGNTANVIVYPKWPNEYTVRCLDTYGDPVYYTFVTDDNTSDAEYENIATEINKVLANIQNKVDKDKKVMVIVWERDGSTFSNVTAKDIKDAVAAKQDFVLAAIPQLQNTSITLRPVYHDTTNELIAYRVAEVAQNDTNTSVVIPDYVGKIPVTIIDDSAAEGFKNLHAVTIPGTIENIGNNAFAKATVNKTFGTLGKLETQTFYYNGSYEEFNAALQAHFDGDYSVFSEKWDSGLGEGSRIFFLKEGKVDPEAGYWQLTKATIEKDNTGSFFSPNFVIVSEDYVWTYYQTVSSNFTSEYTGKCDCGCGTRPDESYWTGVFN